MSCSYAVTVMSCHVMLCYVMLTMTAYGVCSSFSRDDRTALISYCLLQQTNQRVSVSVIYDDEIDVSFQMI